MECRFGYGVVEMTVVGEAMAEELVAMLMMANIDSGQYVFWSNGKLGSRSADDGGDGGSEKIAVAVELSRKVRMSSELRLRHIEITVVAIVKENMSLRE